MQYQEEITLLNECVYKGYSALSNYLKAPLSVCMMLYISLLGIGIMQGWVKVGMPSFIRSTLKITAIYTFALNWSNQSGCRRWFPVIGFEISSVLVSATPVSLPHFDGEGITASLQTLLIEVAKVGNFLFQKGSLIKLAPLFDGCFVWFAGCLMIAMAFLEMITAQILMATLLIAGPFFIACTLFKPTRVFFERWFGALFGTVFVLMFVNITVAINMTLLQAIISDDFLTEAVNFSLISFVPFYIVSVLTVFQLTRVSTLAMSLGGTIGTSSLMQQSAYWLGSGIRSAFTTGSGVVAASATPFRQLSRRVSPVEASSSSSRQQKPVRPMAAHSEASGSQHE